ncbi:MAG TPA: hypothetical protein VIH60_04965 [Steroidobacteraceae bacterium]|jgi:hypothetical protein
MLSPDAVCAVAALFIVAMVWLRTRMHYAGKGRTGRSLTRAGASYFTALGLALLAAWLFAPYLARLLVPNAPANALLPRVVGFLLVYYLFIPLHRALQARGMAVFR